jgi:mono/diheme cytochrome c family protein
VKLKTALSLAAFACIAGCYEAPPSSIAGPKGGYPLTGIDGLSKDGKPVYKFVLDNTTTPLEEAEIDAKARAQINAALALYFGSPERPVTPIKTPISSATIEAAIKNSEDANFDAESPLDKGRRLYVQHCVHCHGYYGAGDGPTANFLLPKPRDFRMGEFKFTSTKQDVKPTFDDLKRTIAQGIPSTMMPAFGPRDGMPEIGLVAGFAGPPGFDVDAVAQYVRLLAMRGEMERKLVASFDSEGELTADNIASIADGILAAWDKAKDETIKPDAPRPTLAGTDDANKYKAYLKDKGGDSDKILADADKALASNAQNADAMAERARAKLMKGDLDGAISDASKAIELKPATPAAWSVRSYAKGLKGDKDGALADSVKAGDNLFHTDKAQCMACHGPKGKGDGLDPDVTKRNRDVWGLPLRPADLTLGIYRGGRRPVDLFRRVHTGVKGGEMPGFGGQLRAEEIWNLVDYVQSLGLPQLETASK